MLAVTVDINFEFNHNVRNLSYFVVVVKNFFERITISTNKGYIHKSETFQHYETLGNL